MIDSLSSLSLYQRGYVVRLLMAVLFLAIPCISPVLAVDPESFSEMSVVDRVELLDAMVRDWRLKVGNISADVHYYLSSQEIDHVSGQSNGTVLQVAAAQKWSISRFRDYYKLSHQKLKESDPADGIIDSQTTVVYDAENGQRRSLSDKEGDHQNWGSLGPEHPQMLRDCQLMGLIGANIDVSLDANLFDATSRLIANKSTASVEPQGAEGLIEVAFRTTVFKKKAEVTQVFDLNRPGLPFEENILVFTESGELRYRYGMRLSDLVIHDDVWFPGRVSLEAWSSSAPSQVSVHKLVVSNVRLNQLDKNDFVLEFPEGTEVMDEYKNEIYRISKRGERAPSEFVGDDGDRIQVNETDSSSATTILLLVNLLALVAVAGYLIYRKLKA